MDVTIDESSAIPVYRQLVHQVVRAILDGHMGAHAPLPTIRQLATDLDITPATVAKVYQILEGGRLVATAGRRGTFIHEQAQENAKRFLHNEVGNQFRDFLNEQMRFGISPADLKHFIQNELEDFSRRTA